MYLRTLKISVIKYANLQNSIEKAGLKKTKVKLDLLTDIVMLLMVEKGIREGICHSSYQYAKANTCFFL